MEYNAKGYLIPTKKDNLLAMAVSSSRLFCEKNRTACENCWICGKWTAVKIEWALEEAGWSGKFFRILQKKTKLSEPVFLHME
jgi:hypothetical protein